MCIRDRICKLGAELLGVPADAVEFDGKEVFTTEKAGDETKKIALADIATASMYGHEIPLEVTESRTAHISPPPFCLLYTSQVRDAYFFPGLYRMWFLCKCLPGQEG